MGRTNHYFSMKRFSVLLVFFFCLFTQLKAQDKSFGVKGGLNLSQVFTSIENGFKPRLSYHAGVFADFPLSGKWSFHPELMYSRQGAKFRLSDLNIINPGDPSLVQDSESLVFGSDYLQMPLLFKVNFIENFSLDFGPQVGIQINGGSQLDFGPTLGITLGVIDKLDIQARYYLGISDLFRKSSLGGVIFDDDTIDSVIQLSLSYVLF